MSVVVTKKSLGQHWLHDEIILNDMVEAANVQSGDTVLEIGPGLGTLSGQLLGKGAKVIAVEFDKELVPGLRKKFKNNPDFILYQSDILRFDFSSLPSGYKVAANIPYYLTSNLLRLLCEMPNHFLFASLLVQKEVAERVCAVPGNMSLLSVSVQLYADATLGAKVPANLFTPPPKVDSQILCLTHLGKPRYAVDDKIFFKLVKAGFSERRKKLRSSLSSGLSVSKPEVEALLAKANIDPHLRAQALALSDWKTLYDAYVKAE
ncbi:MAG: 16S rRNA (adenine(1518)-N(6)/adenine(1519)-N(6))-dimethyltransferase RsmA [bacterium]|nr:16S rRNA (adenine(1518)-N(6)/adenine(1519)-N(6))-dimethyltransferase RsmA [bacterium]